jgi:superoxide dismutase
LQVSVEDCSTTNVGVCWTSMGKSNELDIVSLSNHEKKLGRKYQLIICLSLSACK